MGPINPSGGGRVRWGRRRRESLRRSVVLRTMMMLRAMIILFCVMFTLYAMGQWVSYERPDRFITVGFF